jgi:hypothetical protein
MALRPPGGADSLSQVAAAPPQNSRACSHSARDRQTLRFFAAVLPLFETGSNSIACPLIERRRFVVKRSAIHIPGCEPNPVFPRLLSDRNSVRRRAPSKTIDPRPTQDPAFQPSPCRPSHVRREGPSPPDQIVPLPFRAFSKQIPRGAAIYLIRKRKRGRSRP